MIRRCLHFSTSALLAIGGLLAGCRAVSAPAEHRDGRSDAGEPDVRAPDEREQPRTFLVNEVPLTWDTGDWCCAICGTVERQTRHDQQIVERSPTRRPDCETDVRAFREWFVSSIADEHEHAWLRLGCHSLRSEDGKTRAVGCVITFPYHEWFSALPGFPVELARSLLRRLGAAPAAHQGAMVRWFEVGPDTSPIARAGRGDHVAEEELELSLLRWELSRDD